MDLYVKKGGPHSINWGESTQDRISCDLHLVNWFSVPKVETEKAWRSAIEKYCVHWYSVIIGLNREYVIGNVIISALRICKYFIYKFISLHEFLLNTLLYVRHFVFCCC